MHPTLFDFALHKEHKHNTQKNSSWHNSKTDLATPLINNKIEKKIA